VRSSIKRMGDEGSAGDDVPLRNGSDEVPRRLREAREQAGLSLRQLARRLDISASALSQIETGKSRPSVRTLYAVVSELGLSLDELFDNHGAVPPRPAQARPPAGVAPVAKQGSATVWMAGASAADPVQRAGGRPSLDLATGVRWERLTSEHDPMIDFLEVTYDPGSASNAHGALVRHAGREYGVVLEGEITVTVGFETYKLSPGDSISFSSDEPHVLENTSKAPAKAIWFVVGRRQSDPRKPVFEEDPALADAHAD
jgi:transcriptional regulator with XRE-family HTH domain